MGIRSAYSRYKNRIVRNVLVGTIGTLFVMGIGYTTYRIVPALVPEPKFDLPDWIGMERRTYEMDGPCCHPWARHGQCPDVL